MNTDSYFNIGSSHKVCQDYALSGTFSPSDNERDYRDYEVAYAVISDGCSGSDKFGRVDFGASLLCFQAVASIKKEYFRQEAIRSLAIDPRTPLTEVRGENQFFPHIFDVVGHNTITNAKSKIEEMYIDSRTLDATLVVAFGSKDNVWAAIYGDGMIIVKYKNGDIKAHSVVYPSGAPYYLSYVLDVPRTTGYRKQFGEKVFFERHIIPASGEPSLERDETLFQTKFHMYFKPSEEDIESISVVSDGITSFLDPENNPLLTEDMIREFCGFKTNKGKFVERRLSNGLLRKCEKEGIHHYDDISCASIHFG